MQSNHKKQNSLKTLFLFEFENRKIGDLEMIKNNLKKEDDILVQLVSG
jgi:hypothetical protein